jgi:hypothetical protein
MTIDPVEVQRHLGGVMFPATREELLEAARDEDAPLEVEEALEELPEEERFDGLEEVMEAIES